MFPIIPFPEFLQGTEILEAAHFHGTPFAISLILAGAVLLLVGGLLEDKWTARLGIGLIPVGIGGLVLGIYSWAAVLVVLTVIAIVFSWKGIRFALSSSSDSSPPDQGTQPH